MIEIKRIKPSAFWYIVGYFAADGSLSIDGRHLNFTSKDEEHLFLIKNILNLKVNVGKKSRISGGEKKYFNLQFGDVKFYKFLVSKGFSTRKSLNLGPIRVEKDFFGDFLRGVIDGDGSISTWIHKTNRNRQWSLRIFSGSQIFAKWLFMEINNIYKVSGKLYAKTMQNRVNKIYISKFGKKAAKVILRQIYYSDCVSLDRKYRKAQMCMV